MQSVYVLVSRSMFSMHF